MTTGKVILVVDDNPAERDVFTTFLQFAGGQVLQAGDGVEALTMIERHRPRLVLLDLSMPRMDGRETMRRLRQDPSLASIPVIALTAQHLEWEDLEEAGFRGYLEKPIQPFRVLEEVEAWIGPLTPGEDPKGPRGTLPWGAPQEKG